MTINVVKIVSPDLFVENESIAFNPHLAILRVGSVPALSAVTFIATKSGASYDLDELAVACGNEAMAFILNIVGDNYRAWLFVSDGPWKPATRVARHKKLWKNHADLVSSNGVLEVGEEAEMESGGLVRFAGLLEVTGEAFIKAIRLVRTNWACAIIFSKRANFGSQASARSIFLSAFPKTNGVQRASIDWMTLAMDICPLGDILIRVSGLFDDHEAAVDVIADKGLLLKRKGKGL
jgi:hypothetical protein